VRTTLSSGASVFVPRPESSWGGRRYVSSLISERHLGETASGHICQRRGYGRLLRPDTEVSKMRYMARPGDLLLDWEHQTIEV
jgi:hypothetical protein